MSDPTPLRVKLSREDADLLADLCSAELKAWPDDWDDPDTQERLARLERRLRAAKAVTPV